MKIGSQFEDKDFQEITNYGTGLLRYGLLNNLELRLGVDYSKIKNKERNIFLNNEQSNFGSLLLGFKIGVAKEQGVFPEIALLGNLSLPYTSKFVKMTGIDFRFAFSHTLSVRSGLAYNLGAGWDGENNGLQYIYTLSYGYSLTNRLGWYGEVYGDAPENREASHFVDSGFTYQLVSNFQLDAYIGTGLKGDTSLIVGGGFSYRIPN